MVSKKIAFVPKNTLKIFGERMVIVSGFIRVSGVLIQDNLERFFYQ